MFIVRVTIKIYIFFLSRGIILWIVLPWPEKPANTYAHWTAVSTLLGRISSVFRDLPQ